MTQLPSFLTFFLLPSPFSVLSSFTPELPFFLTVTISLFRLLFTASSGGQKDTMIDLFSDITEPTGWNDVLDQAWRAAVDQAESPTVLMECVLLLEHYIHKTWLMV